MSVVVDHLVYACPDLAEGVRRVEALFGTEAARGGRHEGLGTRNALIGLGPASYLEVVSVDPHQAAPAGPRWFGLDRLVAPRLVTWATPAAALDEVVLQGARVGVDLGPISGGSRRRPDGSELSWTFTDPRSERLGGIVPFFIDWGSSQHPARGLPTGCSLRGLRAEHPDAGRVADVLATLGVELPVGPGPEPRLIAVIHSPNGPVELS